MQVNLQNNKQREQNKKGEIIPLVDGQSQNYAENNKRIKKIISEN